MRLERAVEHELWLEYDDDVEPGAAEHDEHDEHDEHELHIDHRDFTESAAPHRDELE